MKKYIVMTLVLILALSLAVGCDNSADDQDASSGDKKKIELLYGEWDSTVASNNVLKAVFQERLGYDAEITSVSMSAIWQGIAAGDADGMIAAWLPTTHDDYYQQFKDDVEMLGVNLDGTKLGLAVPKYMENINSIEDLQDNFDLLDGEIVGIDPGAGLTTKTKVVMKEYGLDNFELIAGSDATMVAALGAAINSEEPIVVTAFSPHWMFGRWDLKYLDDPKEIYGGEEQIQTVVRKGLKEDDPVAYKLLDNFNWTPEEMGEVMNMNQEEGSDPYENAKIWIEENKDKVDEWLK